MPRILVGLLVAAVMLAPIVVCAQKGKVGLAIAGLLLPPLWPFAVIGAVMIAKPDSTWATRNYEPDGEFMRRARGRWPSRVPAPAPGAEPR